MKQLIRSVAARLSSLSFRTGIIVLLVCAMCYIISFAQMILPISPWLKGVLWAVFYGMAKAAQYSALLILGKAGIQRIKAFFGRKPCRQQ